MFHFNKKHLEDQAIPMWSLKTQGKTFYVNHVHCKLPWDTKETPDNPATKGSIKIKESLLVIDNENNATISELTLHDKVRLNNAKKGITRVITRYVNNLREALKNNNIKHGPIKSIGGACTTTFYITDVYNAQDVTLLGLVLSEDQFRILMPNEGYYKMYDDPKYAGTSDIDLDADDWSDDL